MVKSFLEKVSKMERNFWQWLTLFFYFIQSDPTPESNSGQSQRARNPNSPSNVYYAGSYPGQQQQQANYYPQASNQQPISRAQAPQYTENSPFSFPPKPRSVQFPNRYAFATGQTVHLNQLLQDLENQTIFLLSINNQIAQYNTSDMEMRKISFMVEEKEKIEFSSITLNQQLEYLDVIIHNPTNKFSEEAVIYLTSCISVCESAIQYTQDLLEKILSFSSLDSALRLSMEMGEEEEQFRQIQLQSQQEQQQNQSFSQQYNDSPPAYQNSNFQREQNDHSSFNSSNSDESNFYIPPQSRNKKIDLNKQPEPENDLYQHQQQLKQLYQPPQNHHNQNSEIVLSGQINQFNIRDNEEERKNVKINLHKSDEIQSNNQNFNYQAQQQQQQQELSPPILQLYNEPPPHYQENNKINLKKDEEFDQLSPDMNQFRSKPINLHKEELFEKKEKSEEEIQNDNNENVEIYIPEEFNISDEELNLKLKTYRDQVDNLLIRATISSSEDNSTTIIGELQEIRNQSREMMEKLGENNPSFVEQFRLLCAEISASCARIGERNYDELAKSSGDPVQFIENKIFEIIQQVYDTDSTDIESGLVLKERLKKLKHGLRTMRRDEKLPNSQLDRLEDLQENMADLQHQFSKFLFVFYLFFTCYLVFYFR